MLPHPTLQLLDRALDLVRQEEAALYSNEETSLLEELIEERERIMEEAWSVREGCDLTLLRSHLLELQTAVERLIAVGEQEFAETKQQLSTKKKQNGYFSDAKARSTHYNKRLLFDKLS